MVRTSLELIIIATSLFLLGQPACASDNKEIEQLLAKICDKHKVPSLTLAVVTSDDVIAVACSGVRKRGADGRVSLTDRHPLGSCTKSFTATLAAALIETGKIQWKTTINDVWPDAPATHLHPALRTVTLNDLLSHQSGLQSDIDGEEWSSFFLERTSPSKERRRMLTLLMKTKPKHARGEYNYSNLGYVVAAAMLEKTTGKSYESLMRQNVFEPLQLNSAEFRTLKSAKKLRPPFVWGHRNSGSPIDPRLPGAENPSVYAPCGTLTLTIADYSKYAQWHLKELPTPVLSEQQTVDHLHAGHVDSRNVGGKYGCGWIVLSTPMGRAWTHGGSNTNSRALIWILPDRDFAAVALTNTGEQTGFLASDEAIREMMKKYAR